MRKGHRVEATLDLCKCVTELKNQNELIMEKGAGILAKGCSKRGDGAEWHCLAGLTSEGAARLALGELRRDWRLELSARVKGPY